MASILLFLIWNIVGLDHNWVYAYLSARWVFYIYQVLA